MWKGRFKEDMAQVVLGFNQSLDLDWRMAEHDIEGSLAHVRMLGAAGLLPSGETAKIEAGLRQVQREVRDGTFQPSEALEDVHMNIEDRLTALENKVTYPDGGAVQSRDRRRDDKDHDKFFDEFFHR